MQPKGNEIFFPPQEICDFLGTPEVTETPALRQYREAKEAHPDAILLFRMGDFYEIFN